MKHPISISNIYISKGHDFKGRFGQGRLSHETISVEAVECVAGRGLRGDRFFDYKENFKGQITFLGRDTIDAVLQAVGLQSVDPIVFRRNVVLDGIDLNELVGKTFELGGIRFQGSEECSPCFWMDESVGEGAFDAMKGRGGLRCRILTSGTLSKGDALLEVVGAS